MIRFIFKENNNVSDFVSFLNIQHLHLHFTYETEKDHQLPFIGINITRNKKCTSLIGQVFTGSQHLLECTPISQAMNHLAVSWL